MCRNVRVCHAWVLQRLLRGGHPHRREQDRCDEERHGECPEPGQRCSLDVLTHHECHS